MSKFYPLSLIFSLLVANSILCQKQIILDIGGGMTIGKMLNSEKFQRGVAYEVEPLMDKNIYFRGGYQLKNKLSLHLDVGLITTGYKTRFYDGFDNIQNYPIHSNTKKKYDYYKVGVGFQYKFHQRNSFLLNVHNLLYIEDVPRAGYDIITIFTVDNRSYQNPLEVRTTETTDYKKSSFTIELGLVHTIWKKLHFQITYVRGLTSAFDTQAFGSLYNNSFTFSIGYSFLLKNKSNHK